MIFEATDMGSGLIVIIIIIVVFVILKWLNRRQSK